MTPSTLKNRVKALLAKSATPELKRHGFRKRGNVYVRPTGDVCHLVDVQYSRWNDSSEVSFTLNCGVWMRGVTSSFRNVTEPVRSDQPIAAFKPGWGC